ncbi:inositol monophosphatase 3 [Tetranychus urticae]|uniref:inositol-phosphate phosphatase n=1 Tax=Tetranychus urticae TaxID=32264 RepID=T1JX66_TETUR|nr:inositol monophosphatase 3 [Tetranychus urticae]
MWPYMIRLNPFGFIVALVLCISVYLLYTSSSLTNDVLHNIRARKREPNLSTALGGQTIDLKNLLVTLIRAAERGGKEVVGVMKNRELHSRAKSKDEHGKDELLTEGDLRSHQMMVLQVSAKFPGLRIISEEKESPDSDGFFLPFGELQDLLYADDIHNLPSSLVSMEDLVVWIDPLDATQEYTENLTQYVTTMACVAVKGVATIGIIHEPFSQETYWAWKDTGLSESVEDLVLNLPQSTSRDKKRLRFIVSRSHTGDIKNSLAKLYKDDYDVITAGGSGYKALQLIKGNADAYVHSTSIKKWDICAPNALLNSVQNSLMTDLKGNTIDYNDTGDVYNRNGLLATYQTNHQKILQAFKNLASSIKHI